MVACSVGTLTGGETLGADALSKDEAEEAASETRMSPRIRRLLHSAEYSDVAGEDAVNQLY